jgi:signal transduction histidine kinase
MPIAELMQDVMQKFQLRADQSQISLEWEPPTEQQIVMADYALTERVLNNLISNAFDHVPEGGCIRLGIEALSHKRVRVSVSDNGSGIPSEDMELIFEPFYRGQTGKRVSGHAGLGLAIARRMVELQGGEILAENHPAGGARFSFTLPKASL